MVTTGNQDGDAHNGTGTRMAAGCHMTAVRLVPGSTHARMMLLRSRETKWRNVASFGHVYGLARRQRRSVGAVRPAETSRVRAVLVT